MRLKSTVLMLGLCLLATGCATPPKFVQTAVPADFAIAVEQSTATSYARQTTRQVVTASDMMSRTTFTYYRDYNNSITQEFTTEHPVSSAQLQAMWDEVARHKLLQGGSAWYYWSAHMDDYRHNERVMEIRAGGQSKSYKQLNHWDNKLLDLALDVEAARLEAGQGAGTQPATAPATGQWMEIKPAIPATMPATIPATQP